MKSESAAFLLSTLVATGCGAVALHQHHYPRGVSFGNLVAWLLGALCLLGASKWKRSSISPSFVLAAGPLLITLSFFGPAQMGIHRWIGLGPVNFNAAALVLPALIAAAANSAKPIDTMTTLFVSACLLLAQPDASQATALALAAIPIARRAEPKWHAPFATALLLITIAVWWRADPLEPVASTEGILALCWRVSPFLAIVASLALASTCFIPWRSKSLAGLALSLYFAGICLAPLLGNFPVPLAGFGLSFPIGMMLGFGLLLHFNQRKNAGWS